MPILLPPVRWFPFLYLPLVSAWWSPYLNLCTLRCLRYVGGSAFTTTLPAGVPTWWIVLWYRYVWFFLLHTFYVLRNFVEHTDPVGGLYTPRLHTRCPISLDASPPLLIRFYLNAITVITCSTCITCCLRWCYLRLIVVRLPIALMQYHDYYPYWYLRILLPAVVILFILMVIYDCLPLTHYYTHIHCCTSDTVTCSVRPRVEYLIMLFC